jgi:hypothetical protein
MKKRTKQNKNQTKYLKEIETKEISYLPKVLKELHTFIIMKPRKGPTSDE